MLLFRAMMSLTTAAAGAPSPMLASLFWLYFQFTEFTIKQTV